MIRITIDSSDVKLGGEQALIDSMVVESIRECEKKDGCVTKKSVIDVIRKYDDRDVKISKIKNTYLILDHKNRVISKSNNCKSLLLKYFDIM